MAKLYIPINEKIGGPWLIGRKELDQLDSIFDYVNEQLVKSYDNEIEFIAKAKIREQKKDEKDLPEFIQNEIDSRFNRANKNAVIISSDGKRIFDPSIKELLKAHDLKEFRPKEILLKAQKGDNNVFELELSTGWTNGLEYHLEAYDSDVRDDLRDKIETWVEENKPNRINRFWSGWGYILCFIAFFFGIIAASNLYYTPDDSFIDLYKKQAHALISKGITKDNQQEAIDLILKIESNYSTSTSPPKEVENIIAYETLEYSIVFFIIFLLTPTTIIGLGKSKNKLRFYKFWINFVQYILPIYLLKEPILQFIQHHAPLF